MTEPQRQDELPLAQRILQSGIPRLLAPERAASFVAEFLNKAVCSGSAADDAAFLRETDAGAFVAAVAEGSRFLKMAFNRDPANVVRILRMSPERHLEELVGGLLAAAREDIPAKAWMQRLRTFKHEAALVIALCDLGGAWSIMKVTQALTQAADAAVAASIEHLFEQAVRRGDWLAEAGCTSSAASSGYFILAMGKHGAGELNFSSDIDLIVFYEPSKARLRAGLSPSEFFIRMTRDLVRFMNERTADGYVFRTDLRLRPDPGATHVAMSIASALHYYESFGQNWERAAMIKARPIAGDMAQGRAFLAELAPFIWRKYLDFAAIADIHAMKRQIHAHRGFAKIAVEGHNIKLGRGGIREIEFFAQTQQLIAGGRQPDLRVQRTLDALAALAERGWIEPEVQMALDEAYCFLRRIEHRIQMVGDEQTHLVPREPEALASLARFSGYSTSAEFSDALRCRLETVQRHYAALFEHGPELGTATANLVLAGEEDDPDTVAALAAMGFTQPSQVLTTVRAWHRGRYPAIRSGGARERLTEVQPLLIEALSRTVNPDAALAGFDRFLSTLPAGIQLFALLKANPELLRLMADIMGSAPRLAAILSRRRRVFDAVLDPRILGSLPTAEEVDEMIRGELSAAATIEEVMDRARVIGREQMFLIGVRLLTGAIGADQAGPAYAIVAEQLIRHLHAAIEDDFTAQHGRVPGGAAAIVAMGKLGGREITASSDLDLIVVYDFDPKVKSSDGPKPLPVSQYYARLTQRLISSISAPTAEGRLFEVDMRLRPSGNQGPVATQLSSFVDYQEHHAWTWEQMALTRARVVSGPEGLRQRIELAIAAALVRPRDALQVAAEVRDMRERIWAQKGTEQLWQLKQTRGGQVDLEFIAQYLQLVHAHDHPSVLSQNTLGAFQGLRDAGVLSEAAAVELCRAGELLNTLTQLIRLCFEGTFLPADAPDGLKSLLAASCGEPDFSRLEARLGETLATVGRLYDELIPSGE